jgi:putative redox protein
LALGAGTAISLRMYAERKEWSLSGVHVDVHFMQEGKKSAIARVLSFEGELDIAERTPVKLTLKQCLRRLEV